MQGPIQGRRRSDSEQNDRKYCLATDRPRNASKSVLHSLTNIELQDKLHSRYDRDNSLYRSRLSKSNLDPTMDSIDVAMATDSQDQIQAQTQDQVKASAQANTTNHPLIIVDNNTISWFFIPLEIRKKIYQELTINVRVNVDAASHPTVYFFHSRHGQANAAPGNFGHLFGPLLPTPSFLTICKKFFHEVRDVVWNTARIKFERRWDLITAFANQSLEVDPPDDYPHIGYSAISMSPMYTDVFSKISDLRINLTEASDFNGNVSFQVSHPNSPEPTIPSSHRLYSLDLC